MPSQQQRPNEQSLSAVSVPRTRRLAWLFALAAVAAGLWFWFARETANTYQFDTVALSRGSLASSISASGTITPEGSVSVGSQVSGQVQEVLVDFNDEVKAGQLIARLDPATYEQRVRQAQADLDAANAQVQVQLSQANARRADITRTQVNLADARRDLVRKKDLLTRGFISSADHDRSLTVARALREDLRAARAAYQVADAQIANAKAVVAQREAALANTRVDLERTNVRSPIDGVVIKRSIDAGQTVAASLQSPVLFIIARNLIDMRVEASVDENDIGVIRKGMPASFRVDAFATQKFTGRVDQIRMSAEDVQSVITYTVLIRFENASRRLLPGMTANVQIETARRDDVLRIPNQALRLKAPEKLLDRHDAVSNSPGHAVRDAQAAIPDQAGGGRLRQARNKLFEIIKPDKEQGMALDDVYKRFGKQFAGVRSLPAEQRSAQIKKIRSQLREAVGQLLSPEQLAAWSAATGDCNGAQATIYRPTLLNGNKGLDPVRIRTGISDGVYTELLQGELSVGDAVVLSVTVNAENNKGLAGVMRLFR